MALLYRTRTGSAVLWFTNTNLAIAIIQYERSSKILVPRTCRWKWMTYVPSTDQKRYPWIKHETTSTCNLEQWLCYCWWHQLVLEMQVYAWIQDSVILCLIELLDEWSAILSEWNLWKDKTTERHFLKALLSIARTNKSYEKEWDTSKASNKHSPASNDVAFFAHNVQHSSTSGCLILT